MDNSHKIEMLKALQKVMRRADFAGKASKDERIGAEINAMLSQRIAQEINSLLGEAQVGVFTKEQFDFLQQFADRNLSRPKAVPIIEASTDFTPPPTIDENGNLVGTPVSAMSGSAASKIDPALSQSIYAQTGKTPSELNRVELANALKTIQRGK